MKLLETRQEASQVCVMPDVISRGKDQRRSNYLQQTLAEVEGVYPGAI